MDHKKSSPMRRTKRQAKAALEDNFWDCSVCTYRNNAEAFKCLMCDVRKGTSTRKPRINPQLVAQQVASQFLPAATSAHPAVPVGGGGVGGGGRHHQRGKDKRALKKRRHPARLKNVDRSTAQTREVTVNSVTVVITEYKPKAAKGPQEAGAAANTSTSSSESHSESSMDAR